MRRSGKRRARRWRSWVGDRINSQARYHDLASFCFRFALFTAGRWWSLVPNKSANDDPPFKPR